MWTSDLKIATRTVRQHDRFSAINLMGLAVLMSCLSHLGMALYTVEIRLTDVGVRKVLGAARGALVGQFLAEAVLTALLALGLALVLARLSLPLFHALAGTTLAVALATVGSNAYRAARLDPTKALRIE